MIDERYPIASIEQFVGRELGVSEWIVVTQDMINHFAETTGDRQWIHVDVERARRESPFGGPIAHGYLTLSLVAGMSQSLGAVPKDAVAAFNYGLDKVRFLTPVKAGAKIRCKVVLAEVVDQGEGRKVVKMTNTVEIDDEAKPALVADTLALSIGRP